MGNSRLKNRYSRYLFACFLLANVRLNARQLFSLTFSEFCENQTAGLKRSSVKLRMVGSTFQLLFFVCFRGKF